MKSEAPLIIHTEWSRSWGGEEIRILEELRAMRSYGLATALITPEHGELYNKAKAEGFTVHPVSFKSKVHLPSWINLFKLIYKLRPAVVNTHSSEDSWMAGSVSRILKVPLIIRTRHMLESIGSNFSYKYFPHLILTTSAAIRKKLIQSGINSRKIVSVPSGIDVDRFKFSQKNRDEIRQNLGISENDILVGNVCFFRGYKGLSFFVDTAAVMNSEFKFILIGDGDMRGFLENKVKSLGLKDRFFFTGHQEQVERFFSALDIFFFTSYANEGVPQALVQAMSVGLPLLICRTPSVIETVKPIGNFISIDYGDIEAAKTSLINLTQRLNRNEHKVQYNRLKVENKYGLQHMLDQIITLYKQNGIC
ncbi:Glycosyltransferase family 1 protein [Candidatus Magnetomoraceae bacterium gMMP-1]